MVKVIYIIGAGHSGSTLLDIVLSNHPDIEGVGELTNLVCRGWKLNEYCACGEPGNDCPFWSAVRQEWFGRTGANDLDSYLALERKFATYSQWKFLRSQRQAPDPDFAEYARRTVGLFEAIQHVSGKSIIVDSSKIPVRGLALTMMPEIDLRIIHLVRDPRGVAWSLKKKKSKDDKAGIAVARQPIPVWRTAVSWCRVNLRSEWVFRQVLAERAVRVRYEEFAAQPQEVLEKIGHIAGCDLRPLASALAEGAVMEVHHPIAGNRMRMGGSIKLRPDTEWMEKLPAQEQRTVQALAGFVMRRYCR
jgi:hypothetical protein